MSAIKRTKPGLNTNLASITQNRRKSNTRNRTNHSRNPRLYKINRKYEREFFLKKPKNFDSFVENILSEFKDPNDRQILIEKIATASGYKCTFKNEHFDFFRDEDRNFRQRLLAGDPDFSINPPKKWQNRDKKDEKLIDFVSREYQSWIGKNLLQSHIRKYDMPLYYALANYQSRYGISIWKELGILSKREATEALIAEAGGVSDPTIEAAFRWKDRVRVRQWRSRQKKLDNSP